MSSSEITAAKGTVDPARAGAVRLDRVTHRYGRGGEAFTAVGPVDLTVPSGSSSSWSVPPAAARARCCG